MKQDFLNEMRSLMDEAQLEQLLAGLQQQPPVSIRLNPNKQPITQHPSPITQHSPVPWCPEGRYLQERPSFTFDPLLHAGAYYVQEASSMFVTHVLRHLTSHPSPITPHPSPITHHPSPITLLDLCAAPGGKSTCALSVLPPGSVVFANEPISKRAQILSENIQKWLSPCPTATSLHSSIPPCPTTTSPHSSIPPCSVDNGSAVVTSNYARDYKKAKLQFDIILADVPCSGEGMFRKDPKAEEEWSLQNVEKCWRLQRDIVSDIWSCLKPGGFMVYSTCTFNTHENEENVQWIARELGADIVEIPVSDDWHITGSLLSDFHEPVYRFLPGFTIGEGLFMAVLRKHGEWAPSTEKERAALLRRGQQQLHTLPHEFLNALNEHQSAPHIALTYEQAIAYLRHEALTLPPDTPRGIVVVSYQGLSLGLAKNIGNRANNLYPKEWRIKSTHVPT